MVNNSEKIGEVLKSWVTMELKKRHKGTDTEKISNSVVTPSFIVESSLDSPIIRNILSSMDGEELIEGIFIAYNLLNGDSMEMAKSKVNKIYVIDYVEKISEPHFIKDYCGNCDGDGEFQCDGCDGDDLDCFVCDGTGRETCQECDGEGEIESNDEVVDTQYGTILTQNQNMVNELDKRTSKDKGIDDFHGFLERYIGEIIVVDKVFDTILYDDEWYLDDAATMGKLESVSTNLTPFRVNGKKLTSNQIRQKY